MLDTGVANAYVVALNPAISTYTDGLTIKVKIAASNTGTATINAGGGAVALVNDVGGALVSGDISAGAVIEVTYVASENKFRITSIVQSQTLTQTAADARYALIANAISQAAADARYGSSFANVGATVAANALTATLNPGKLDFRSNTLTNGGSNNRSIATQLSLVVPSGATLGTINAIQARLVLLAIDNAGVVELAITNLSGGLNLDETTLITTTAISSTSNSAGVIYSAAPRVNVPYLVVGFIDITQATAGTWATAPSTVQCSGGNALSAIGSIGYGQSWQAVTRVSGSTYYNNTGRPISLSLQMTASTTSCSGTLTVGGMQLGYCGSAAANADSWQLTAIIPPGASYSFTASGMTVGANELR